MHLYSLPDDSPSFSATFLSQSSSASIASLIPFYALSRELGWVSCVSWFSSVLEMQTFIQ